MGEYHISGGKRLRGSLTVQGSKNAILPILAAVVLNGDVSVIHNCPRISDTIVAVNILKAMGCKVKINGTSIEVDSRNADNFAVPEEFVREMRSSIIFLGGALGRFKQVKISYPGGCDFLLELKFENTEKVSNMYRIGGLSPKRYENLGALPQGFHIF